VIGAEITDCPHEGPNVFELSGVKWMITDFWSGLAVYRSEDFSKWTRCEENLLNNAGKRCMDNGLGHHADVVVSGDEAYIFYFCHPEAHGKQAASKPFSVVQVARITTDGKNLFCNRDEKFSFRWGWGKMHMPSDSQI